MKAAGEQAKQAAQESDRIAEEANAYCRGEG
jgi:hypothetical protein